MKQDRGARRRLRTAVIAASFALAGASVAMAGISVKGQQAPELGNCEWVQGTPVEGGLKAMKGKVVLLEFFGTG